MTDVPSTDPDDRSCVCFLVLTRPTLIFGVPVEGFFGNLCLCFFGGIFYSDPSTMWRCPLIPFFAALPIHFMLKRLTGIDFFIFRSFKMWLESHGTGRDRLEAVAVEAPGSAREIASCV